MDKYNSKSKMSRTTREATGFRKDRPRKRKFQREDKQEGASTFAKKMKTSHNVHVPKEELLEYRIINFVTVFLAISEAVKCKTCDGELKFKCSDTRGLGHKISILCNTCKPIQIPSCPIIGDDTYEINRRFIYALRLLGIGLTGARKFCGIMDFPAPVAQFTYDKIVKTIENASAVVCEMIMRKAIEEEQQATKEDGGDSNKLTVSGDGTWKKRGFSSLFGVSTLIGTFTGKVVDAIMKSSHCKSCEYWQKKKGTIEYEEWNKHHGETCMANHEGSAGKMEVDAIKEMFQRSEERYGIMYANYIGDGDSKTYKGIIDAKPYGDRLEVTKKECIGHVQKRMGTRLRQCVKKNKGLGGRGKLTGNLIDKLTVYYGLAIRRNCESAEKMKTAIWASLDHYQSTDKNPKHENCPPGSESWSSWQQANANNTLDGYRHKHTPLPQEVVTAVEKIYTDLSQEALLQRCVGGYTQNNNESLNNVIWKLCPKEVYCGANIIKIATSIAACTFNEGNHAHLKIMQMMDITSGANAHRWASAEDDRRLYSAERATLSATKEGRIAQRLKRMSLSAPSTSKEEVLYGPGIGDFI